MSTYRHAAAIIGLTIALALSAVACTNNGDAGGREPSIRGVVTDVSRQADRTTMMVVWTDELGEQLELDAASLSIDDKTDVLARRAVAGFDEGQELTADDMRKGLVVEAWIDGPILESYPAQAGASRVEVIDEWDGEMPSPQGLEAPIE